MDYKPFTNDPFGMVYDAFLHLYPEKRDVKIAWNVELHDDMGAEVYGLTTFSDEGAFVEINADQNVCNAVETLAHELAHVAVGADANHGDEWENAFNAIYVEYNRIGVEMFPDHKKVYIEDDEIVRVEKENFP